jgi:hypothetical protein
MNVVLNLVQGEPFTVVNPPVTPADDFSVLAVEVLMRYKALIRGQTDV